MTTDVHKRELSQELKGGSRDTWCSCLSQFPVFATFNLLLLMMTHQIKRPLVGTDEVLVGMCCSSLILLFYLDVT